MRTIICTSVGSTKSISVDTTYTILAESDTKFTIVNDKGIEANYSKKLFSAPRGRRTGERTGNEATPARPVPVPVAPPRPRIEEIGLNVDVTLREGSFAISLSTDAIPGVNFRREASVAVGYQGSAISCGVHQLTGVNGLINTVKSFKSGIFSQLNELRDVDVNVDRDDIDVAEILKSVINGIIEAAGFTGILMMSTNASGTDNGFVAEENMESLDALNEIAATTVETLNPNSGRRIRVWTLQVTE